MQTDAVHNPENLREIDRNIASVVIISADNKILMGRKDPAKGGVYPDVWHIPGGGVDDGETLIDAAKRETLEEVAIDLLGKTLSSLPEGRGESLKTLSTGEKYGATWYSIASRRVWRKMQPMYL